MSTRADRGPDRTWIVAIAVGVVLADSSVVTLGLPDVLRQFRAGVAQVAWVLVSFNLVLALAALPAAAVVRCGGAAAAWRLGIAVFALASLGCALAPNLELLVAARCAQAVGGAAVVAAALALLVGERGLARGSSVWGAAGSVGAAIGPAVGGARRRAPSRSRAACWRWGCCPGRAPSGRLRPSCSSASGSGSPSMRSRRTRSPAGRRSGAGRGSSRPATRAS